MLLCLPSARLVGLGVCVFVCVCVCVSLVGAGVCVCVCVCVWRIFWLHQSSTSVGKWLCSGAQDWSDSRGICVCWCICISVCVCMVCKSSVYSPLFPCFECFFNALVHVHVTSI